MKRILFGVAFACVGISGAAMQACGGDQATVGDVDASSDATSDTSMSPDTGGGDTGTSDASNDAGGSCAPPSDPNQAALCIITTPEAIQFIAQDPNLDGKGLIAFDVHTQSNPDLPDGGQVPPIAFASIPAGDAGADAAEFDLSTPVPVVRFDGLPAGAVYPRVVFVDSRNFTALGAGWWLGNYDLSNGLVANVPLKPVTLTAGSSTTVTIALTALRRLHVTLTRSVTPVGNAQGPARVIATPDQVPTMGSKIFGAGTSPCANVSNNRSAEVNGLVFGNGPYYGIAVLDDYATGGNLPAGSLTTLAFADGGISNPPGTQITYAANAYLVSKTLDLTLAVPKPDAGADNVTCP
jgi:hypothetical protein